MKKLLLFLLLILPLAGYGQFDEQFYQPVKEWKANNLPAYEEIWVTNGVDSVEAIWCKPEREPVAVVFYCHGNYGNISYNDGIIRPLVEEGFAVLAWDYPGFGHSNGKPTHINIAEMGQRVWDELIGREDVKGRKIILFGFSIGAQSAAKLARDNRDRVSGLVLDAGMKSFTDMALVFSPEEAHPMIRQYVVSPYSSIEDVTYLDGMPKLILHSQEDKIAPFSHSEAVYENAADPKTFREYPGGHIGGLIAEPEEVLLLFRRLVE